LKYHARRHQRDHQNFEDSHESVHEDNSFGGKISQPEEAAIGRELERIIQEGLAELTEIHRTIIVLRDVENLSYQEIAEIVELPEGTVKSRLFRARVALKEYVEKRYDS
jgi:RNA polymerase sigma-70 factor (ECF subfamily)